MSFISIIIPCCVFALVALPERLQYPEVTAPTAVAKTMITIPETKPQFGKRILEERRPITYTHVNDDWFALLDNGTKVSGICLPVVWLLSFFFGRQTTRVTLALLHEMLLRPVLAVSELSCTSGSTDRCAHSPLFNHLWLFCVLQIEGVTFFLHLCFLSAQPL